VSHDQRPGRMRVVQDPADVQRRRGDATTIEGRAETVAVASASGGATATAPKQGLPLLAAGLFLLSCAAGGVLVAVLRPLGLG
jgi:hypothetical protein